MIKVGFITIGQSPRIDLHKDITNILKDNIEIIEVGILDEYNYVEALEKFSPDNNDIVFVSRMRDSRQIKMGRNKILPLIQKTINKLDRRNVDIIVLLCTGTFPAFSSKSIFIEPQRLIHSIVKKISTNQKLGILLPDENQLEYSNKIWGDFKSDFYLDVFSPYLKNDLTNICDNIIQNNVDIIYLDCIGYSIEIKAEIKEKTNKPVIIPRTILAHILNELA